MNRPRLKHCAMYSVQVSVCISYRIYCLLTFQIAGVDPQLHCLCTLATLPDDIRTMFIIVLFIHISSAM